jgi:RNA polymerase sigma factor (sigma-70 family)
MRVTTPNLAQSLNQQISRCMETEEKLPRIDQDQALVDRSQAGETEAFDDLVIKYSPKLYAMIYNMTGNREDTHDVLQDVFAKAYRSIRRFRGKSTFYTWIYSISVNMTLNFVKKRGRQQKLSLDNMNPAVLQDKGYQEATSNSDPIREVGIRELQQRLNEALLQLSEDHRTVVTLFDIQGLPHAEISKVLGVSQGTVRSRLFYAHRQLQNYLEEFRR